MAIFKRMSLKQGNTSRTNAAELTLRQSLYPLCLVTVLFFLWVITLATRSRIHVVADR